MRTLEDRLRELRLIEREQKVRLVRGLSVRAIAVRPLQVSPMHTTSHDFH